MFSLFKKNKSPEIPVKDKVWKTESGAIKGMLMMAMMRLQQQQSALIFTFFEEEHQKLVSFMNENQINFRTITESSSSEDMNAPGIFLVVNHSINSSVVSDLLKKNSETLNGTVYFPSHYPLPAYEDKILIHLSGLGYSTFIFCLSFDDPTMKMFGSERMLPLLEKLGLDEHEAIEHNMVTNAIKKARQNLEGKVKSEIKAKSPAEWFALNIKS